MQKVPPEGPLYTLCQADANRVTGQRCTFSTMAARSQTASDSAYACMHVGVSLLVLLGQCCNNGAARESSTLPFDIVRGFE